MGWVSMLEQERPRFLGFPRQGPAAEAVDTAKPQNENEDVTIGILGFNDEPVIWLLPGSDLDKPTHVLISD